MIIWNIISIFCTLFVYKTAVQCQRTANLKGQCFLEENPR